jgi:hypothetical protein
VDFQSSTVSKPKRRKGSRGDVDSVEEMKATGHWFGSIARATKRKKAPPRWAGLGRDGPEDSASYGGKCKKIEAG